MAAVGLTEADLDVTEVWPEHYQAFSIFYSLRTQWRVGFGGPTGLDYGVLHQRLARLNLSPDELDLLELDIQEMEQGALSAMNEKKQ